MRTECDALARGADRLAVYYCNVVYQRLYTCAIDSAAAELTPARIIENVVTVQNVAEIVDDATIHSLGRRSVRDIPSLISAERRRYTEYHCSAGKHRADESVLNTVHVNTDSVLMAAVGGFHNRG